VVPAWLVFEGVPTKLPHYVMPLFPAIAIGTVVAISRGFVGPHRPLARWASLAMPAVPVGVAGAVVFGALGLDGAVPVAALPPLAAAIGVSCLAWRLFLREDVVGAALANVGAAALLAVAVFGLAQPALQSLKVSPRLAEAARAACSAPEAATLGYREPSLVFLTDTRLAMLETGDEAAAFLQGGGCRVAFVERRFEADFRAAAARAGLAPSLSTRVAGFNINGGRRVDIAVYAPAP
jgi:4-amino-4-deoxy-L-arabinose transferase-like glycosyltransferase